MPNRVLSQFFSKMRNRGMGRVKADRDRDYIPEFCAKFAF
jgi:hypothetical protein